MTSQQYDESLNWTNMFNQRMKDQDVLKYVESMKGVKPMAGRINFMGLSMPLTMQINWKFMSGPSKLILLTTLAMLLIEISIRSWAVYSLNHDGNSTINTTWFWITTVSAVIAALVLATVMIIILNTLYFGGHHTMAWVIALGPLLALLGMLLISPTIIDVVMDMLTGKDIAEAVSDTLPGLASAFQDWIEKTYNRQNAS